MCTFLYFFYFTFSISYQKSCDSLLHNVTILTMIDIESESEMRSVKCEIKKWNACSVNVHSDFIINNHHKVLHMILINVNQSTLFSWEFGLICSMHIKGTKSQWRIMDRRLNMRFTVLGARNEISFFCQSYSFRQ